MRHNSKRETRERQSISVSKKTSKANLRNGLQLTVSQFISGQQSAVSSQQNKQSTVERRGLIADSILYLRTGTGTTPRRFICGYSLLALAPLRVFIGLQAFLDARV